MNRHDPRWFALVTEWYTTRGGKRMRRGITMPVPSQAENISNRRCRIGRIAKKPGTKGGLWAEWYDALEAGTNV